MTAPNDRAIPLRLTPPQIGATLAALADRADAIKETIANERLFKQAGRPTLNLEALEKHLGNLVSANDAIRAAQQAARTTERSNP